jgi:hypothetical protein
MTDPKPNPGPLADPVVEAAPEAAWSTYAVAWPTDVFDSQVDGVNPITTAGTDIPPEHLEAVIAAASAANVRLTLKG